jgi:endonuclease III
MLCVDVHVRRIVKKIDADLSSKPVRISGKNSRARAFTLKAVTDRTVFVQRSEFLDRPTLTF